MNKIYYYNSYEDDFIKSHNQDYKLKKNYKWLHQNIFYKFFSIILYILILLFSLIYSKLFLHVTIKNKKILKKEKGYFIYHNHTQMLGDVFNPFLITFPLHPYIICSPANLGIPFLGKLLPMAGALPIPDNIHDMLKFKEAINYHIKKGHPIIIYPESHLWPYATFIRNFPNTSFHFPYENKAQVFTATTTYKKSKFYKKPKIIIYLDGPFQIEDAKTKRENIQKIHDEVLEAMVKRSQLNNYSYITYKKKD